MQGVLSDRYHILNHIAEPPGDGPPTDDAGRFGASKRAPFETPQAADLNRLRLTSGTKRGTGSRTRCIIPGPPVWSNGQLHPLEGLSEAARKHSDSVSGRVNDDVVEPF